jgi:hypothetical protein
MTDDVALTQGDRLSPAVQVTHGSMELQPRDVQHQLAVPPLRPPGVPDRRWARILAWLSPIALGEACRGTTTITRSRRPLATGSAAGTAPGRHEHEQLDLDVGAVEQGVAAQRAGAQRRSPTLPTAPGSSVHACSCPGWRPTSVVSNSNGVPAAQACGRDAVG